jgi:hypothetical protein
MIDFGADVAVLLGDMGQPCIWTDRQGGAVRGSAILDMPGVSLLDQNIAVGTDYAATVDAATFSGIGPGSHLTIGTLAWRVREALLLDDGALIRCTLTKVSP